MEEATHQYRALSFPAYREREQQKHENTALPEFKFPLDSQAVAERERLQ
jgi:hypothetical protein